MNRSRDGDELAAVKFRCAAIRRRYGLAVSVLLVVTATAWGHDTWVQTNTAIVRTGDAIHIDLMLGNHGNDHRDFKIASKVAAEAIDIFEVIAPDGKKYDLKPSLVDLGYMPKEGFYSAKFVPAKAGLYVAAQTSDKVMKYGKSVRGLRSAKAYFLVSPSLDKVEKSNPGFEKPLGHPLELVCEASPVTPMGPGVPIKVKLLFKGKPLTGVKVSFIPRGVTLKEEMDVEHERISDAEGKASFTPRMGTYYLIVAHHLTDEKGEGYESSKYTATLNVLVPEKCACCDE